MLAALRVLDRDWPSEQRRLGHLSHPSVGSSLGDPQDYLG